MKGLIILLFIVMLHLAWAEAQTEVSERDQVREVRASKQTAATGNNGRKKRKNGRKGKGKKKKSIKKKSDKSKLKIKKRGRKNFKNKTKQRSAKGQKRNKMKGRKNKNQKKRGKSKKRKSKNKKVRKQKPKEGKRLSGDSRQTDKECFEDLCAKSKKFNLFQNQMRKAKRVKGWVEQMDKKKTKALTTFENASKAINTATSGGKSCNGGSIPDEAKTADQMLQSCNTTASKLCTSSDISGLNMTLVEDCIPKLQAYVDAYKACLKTCECSCFTALALVEDACTKFDAMDKATKVAKKACTSPSEKGSFGDCRAQERKVAYYGETCKKCPSSMTTKAPNSMAGKLLKERLFQRHAGKI